ncbi:SAM-dependent methyltransferase [Spirochaetia bacterium]|nr:SAM-dependent methyltransferase [Spirochaetia bacterium]
MIRDFKIEFLYFKRHGEYSCKNQTEANEKVYSNEEVMTYYMYALLISQVLWKHHFDIFIYLKRKLPHFIKTEKNVKVLDVGPGHGFYSYIIKNEYPAYDCLDIIDISRNSLDMTEKMLGEERRIHYINMDIFYFNSESKYDLIILGEVLEHLDNPRLILLKLSELLNDDGVLWITAPVNSPAIDHVYLFKSRKEIIDLIEESNLQVIESISFSSEGRMDEETSNKNKITTVSALFCKKSHEVSN